MRYKWVSLIAIGVLVCGVACMETGTGDTSQQQRQGITVQAEMVEGTDVGGMQFTITPCQGGDPVVDEIVPLKEMDLPAGVVVFDGDSFDPESQHRFADYFIALAPGCYDVVIQPKTPIEGDGWQDSIDCAMAFQDDVIVEGELTTEIVLISQCIGDELGALDVIAVLNREPELLDLTFYPNKFVGDCEGTVVCATATDPDCDSLRFAWMQLSGPDPALRPTLVLRERDGCDVTECVRFQPDQVAAYEFRVKVFDLLLWDGQMRSIQAWLYAHGYGRLSHAKLVFPLYSGVECAPPTPR